MCIYYVEIPHQRKCSDDRHTLLKIPESHSETEQPHLEPVAYVCASHHVERESSESRHSAPPVLRFAPSAAETKDDKYPSAKAYG
jgi:hypothetical protein